MPYGFFVTDRGRELIDKAIPSESKVEITTACFGSGGNPEEEFDYSITELKNQFYQKQMDPDTDTYKVDDYDPYTLYIQSELPNEVTGTVNEIGYKDREGNLIFYGVVRERTKEAGAKGSRILLQYRNWIKLENGDLDAIDVKVQSAEYDRVERLVIETKSEFESKYKEFENLFDTTQQEFEDLMGTTQGEVDKMVEQTEQKFNAVLDAAEKDFDLSNYWRKDSALEVDQEDVESLFKMEGSGEPLYPGDWIEASDDDIRALFA